MILDFPTQAMTLYSLFLKGGPVMWPLLAASVAALAVAIERMLFLLRHLEVAQPDLVREILLHVEAGEIQEALTKGRRSQDPVVRVLVRGLMNRGRSLSGALVRAASEELEHFGRGIPTLDTIVTLAPLLGLLGTVTGMVRAFGMMGGRELEASAAITGGIAEALIATAFGLMIAILSLVPLNILNASFSKTKRKIEQAATELEHLWVPDENPLRISSAPSAN